MKARDQWIGWDDEARGRGLQQIVNNSRLLILPKIRNLASTLLSCVLGRVRKDWQVHYGVDPWRVETLVDRKRFHGVVTGRPTSWYWGNNRPGSHGPCP